MTAFLLRKFSLVILFLSAMGASLSGQVEDPILPGGGGNPPPPLPWAITSPAGDLGIAGTANDIVASGTWPLNDPPDPQDPPAWSHKFTFAQIGPFTDPQTGKQKVYQKLFLYADQAGNWSETYSFPNGQFAENNWPAGGFFRIAIGQARFKMVEVLNPDTGEVTVEERLELKTKKSKEVKIKP
jgi:hypothetical protein